MKKTGLIINPKAGQGSQRNIEIAQKALSGLQVDQIITGPGKFGGDASPDAVVIELPEGIQGRMVTQWLTKQLVQLDVDCIVVVGGDGTMADVAFGIISEDKSCPIFGIGAGSINAGELITCQKYELDLLTNAKFKVKTIDALVTGYDDKDLAVAFNDVVISNTILGTVKGKLCNLDAGLFQEGKQVKQIPCPVGSFSSSVTKNTSGQQIVVAQGSFVGTVIVGFALQDCFWGKAIVGGVCLTALEGLSAGCLVSEQPLVRTSLNSEKMEDWEPLRTAYVSLSADDSIQITGMEAPAVLCADGNPIKQLEPDDVLQIRVLPRAVDVMKLVRKDN